MNAAVMPSRPMLIGRSVPIDEDRDQHEDRCDFLVHPSLSLTEQCVSDDLHRDGAPGARCRARSAGGRRRRWRRSASPRAPSGPPGTGASRRCAWTARSALPRSRTTRPCRSSRRRARRPRRPGIRSSSATVAAVPASAFWWQWPWNRIAARAEVLAQRQVGVEQQLLDELGARRDAAVAEQLHVLLAQRQQARRLAAGDQRVARPAARSAPRPWRARRRAGPWRSHARPQQPPLSSRTS